jgi:hypothetical protein
MDVRVGADIAPLNQSKGNWSLAYKERPDGEAQEAAYLGRLHSGLVLFQDRDDLLFRLASTGSARRLSTTGRPSMVGSRSLTPIV